MSFHQLHVIPELQDMPEIVLLLSPRYVARHVHAHAQGEVAGSQTLGALQWHKVPRQFADHLQNYQSGSS
jgi:hypothetical protein